MWSFWSRDPTKDFGYEIQDIVSNDDKSIWVLHKAKKKVIIKNSCHLIVNSLSLILFMTVFGGNGIDIPLRSETEWRESHRKGQKCCQTP